jgi:ribosome production factor 1
LRDICRFGNSKYYNILLILFEDQRKPSGLDLIMLPDGPMLRFSIKTWVDGRLLPNHGSATDHTPELVLTNFLTPFGMFVGDVMRKLFPT